MSIPLSEWSGSGATRELAAMLKEFNEQSSRQTERMLQLTWAILAMTATMSVAVGVQIWLAVSG
jgi:hypothetical protein